MIFYDLFSKLKDSKLKFSKKKFSKLKNNLKLLNEPFTKFPLREMFTL